MCPPFTVAAVKDGETVKTYIEGSLCIHNILTLKNAL